MNFENEPVFADVNKKQIDAVFYQAMFDETIRLRKCVSKSERENIRKFLMAAYQLFAESIHETNGGE